MTSLPRLVAAILMLASPHMAIARQPTPATSNLPMSAAGPTIGDLLGQLHALRQSAAPPAQQIDQVLAQLIEQFPQDDRCATWLIDRAAGRLIMLDADGSAMSVLLGVPTRAQSERVFTESRLAAEYTVLAQSRASEAVRRLERGLMGEGVEDAAAAAERAAVVESRLSELVEVEQAQRIPFHGAWARGLSAAASQAGDRQQQLRAAAAELAALKVHGDRADAARKSILACILRHIDGGEPPTAQIARLIDEARTVPALDPSTSLRIELLLAGSPSSSAMTGRSPLHRLLMAEALARAQLDAGKPGSPGWSQRVARACAALLSVREDSATRALPDADSLRLLIYAKVARIIDPTVPGSALPPEAVFARAISLSVDEPASREIELLFAQLVGRKDLPPDLRADVLWESGVHAIGRSANSTPESPAACPATLAAMVEEFPRDARAPQAAWYAIERCACSAATAPDAAQPAPVSCRSLIQFAVEHPPAGVEAARVDRWRAELLRIQWRTRDPAQDQATLIDRSAALWAQIQDPVTASAVLSEVAPWLNVPSSSPSVPLDPAALLARDRSALRWGRIIAERRAFPGVEAHIALLQLRVGESRVAMKDKGAVEDLLPLVASPAADRPATPERQRFRLALGSALRLAGRNEEALSALRVLADELDGIGGKRPDAYWRAWAEMLELQALGDAQSRAAIPTNIRRLELLDPSLGNEPAVAARIRAAAKP